jgi:hypothetical protein
LSVCGIDYVKKFLDRLPLDIDINEKIYIKSVQCNEKTNPYDELIKDDEKTIENIMNQYEYDIDYEFNIQTIDDIKDEDVRQEIMELYESIDYLNKEITNGIIFIKFILKQNILKMESVVILLTIYYIFVMNIKLNVLGMINNL